ncbi:MAG TPA: DUF2238 domain-containing protein [Flavobacteriales bacterium]|nr:DUF2238 domain-containing protein [Flavobacteriales bacterium]
MHAKKTITLIVVLLAGFISCINPVYPKQMFLQHAATVVILGLLVWDIKKQFLSYGAFLGISVFVLLHIVGARYIYSFVPYNNWSISLFGWNIQETFGFERNHYDRLVHFLFGILIFPFLMNVFVRKFTFSQAILVSFLTLQAFSMVYELFEWLLTLMLSNHEAENYNGQQGDMWDAHKDMGLAMLGSGIAGIYYLVKQNRLPVR